jgi:ABC-type sugar transport system ATPase subunit
MISVENLSVQAGAFSLAGVTFSIPTGSHGILMGRTGSGKTTLLEAVCGLKPVARGAIRLDARDVTALKPGARGIGYVPQDGALFPSMTVADHLGFALVVRRWRPDAIRARVEEMTALLGLGALLSRRPAGLSGGEAQRVALGRALSCHPSVLCLDEPLSALDDETREEMCVVLETVRRRTGVTVLHVTHSRAEAQRLGDCVFHLRDGVVREAGLTTEASAARDGGLGGGPLPPGPGQPT